MLATASLGAVWSSCSPDFGVDAVLDRFGQVEPKVLFAVDGYFYNGKTHGCLAKLREIVPRLPSLSRVVVVPYAAGGAGDIFARVIGAKLGEAFNQQVVIDNRPGAGGGIASCRGHRGPRRRRRASWPVVLTGIYPSSKS